MKRIYAVLLLSVFCLTVLSQEKAGDSVEEVYLLEEFTDGEAKVVIIGSMKGKFNYGIIREKMYFLNEDSAVMILEKTEAIPLIKIGDRVFEHIKNGTYYEKIEVEDVFLYMRVKGRISTVKTGVSEAGAATNISHFMAKRGGMYKIKENNKITVTTKVLYYLKIFDKFKMISSFKSIANIFKKDKDQILDYVKSGDLNFDDVEDVKKVLLFAVQCQNERLK